MWEHKTVTDESLKNEGRPQPNDSYIQLMDYIENKLIAAQSYPLDSEAFLTQLPQQGPWEKLPATDTTMEDPRQRYIGDGKTRFLNTTLYMGSTWIEAERFSFERRINNVRDFLKQRTIFNANMWSPKQVTTTQSLFFCSTGDEERFGGVAVDGDEIPVSHPMLVGTDVDHPEWESILWGLGHKGVIPGSDPQDKVYYPSLMHRNVSFNNRVGWTRYSPAGFGKDANGYSMVKPFNWIWPAVSGDREPTSAFNLLCNLPDRRMGFGEEGITDIYLTTGKTSMYTLMGMVRSPTVRQKFGAGSNMVPLEMHMVEPGLDEWLMKASDEDKYSRLFEVCASIGYLLTDSNIGLLGGGNQRRRLLVYSFDQGNLLTACNASQVADHALKENYSSSVFTKLDQADFQNRQGRRMSGYADLIAESKKTRGAKWITSATDDDGERLNGPNVHTLLSVRGYETITFKEYIDTFSDVSTANERLMELLIQNTAVNALKTLVPMSKLGVNKNHDEAQYQHLFDATLKDPLIYYTDIRFLVPTSIDKLRHLTGSRGADRGKLREEFAALTGADPVTSLSVLDICLPFMAELGEDSWQTGTGCRENEITVEVTMALNPAQIWKNLLQPTTEHLFNLPKGEKGTAAQLWGENLVNNSALGERMNKDGIGNYHDILKLCYYWSHNASKKKHKL